MGHVKTAASSGPTKTASLLTRIYDENPAHWPYGLTPEHFSPNNLFLVYKSAMSNDPVGFVGWQERDLGGTRVGLYSVGMLPEFRGRGVAKEAIAKLIDLKSAGVDRVAAMVVDGNVASEKLAARLGVPLLKIHNKAAGRGMEVLKNIGAPVAGGVATTLFQDNLIRGGQEGHHPLQAFNPMDPNNSGKTNFINGLNFILGARGAHDWRSGSVAGGNARKELDAATNIQDPVRMMKAEKAIEDASKRVHFGVGEMTVGPIVKDVLLDSHHAIKGLGDMGKAAPQIAEAVKGLGNRAQSGIGKAIEMTGGYGPAALGVGGLMGAAYLVSRALKRPEPGGRLRVTLPTKNPGDAETSLELPYNPNTALTPALRSRIDLDTRRRLYAETRQRVHRRGQPAPDMLVN